MILILVSAFPALSPDMISEEVSSGDEREYESACYLVLSRLPLYKTLLSLH
jgi:hypothetical protein